MRHTCTTGLSLILYLYFWSLWFSNSTPVGSPKDQKAEAWQTDVPVAASPQPEPGTWPGHHLAVSPHCLQPSWHHDTVTRGPSWLSWHDISHVISTRKITGTIWQLADSADIWHNTSVLWVASVLYIALMLGNASLALWLCCKDRKMLYFWHATEILRSFETDLW